MNPAVKEMLESFDELPEADRHLFVVEVLRRENASAKSDIPETALVEAADELFRVLDAEEDTNAQR